MFILPFKFVVSPQLLILFLSSPIKGGCNSEQEKKSDYFVQPFPGLSDTLPLPLPLQSGTARTSSSPQNLALWSPVVPSVVPLWSPRGAPMVAPWCPRGVGGVEGGARCAGDQEGDG